MATVAAVVVPLMMAMVAAANFVEFAPASFVTRREATYAAGHILPKHQRALLDTNADISPAFGWSAEFELRAR